MLAAPPADEEDGRGTTKFLPPSTEMEEPPPVNVDNNVVEPELCSRRLSLPKLSWLRPVEVRKVRGSDLRPGDSGDGDFKAIGGRSELQKRLACS